MWHYFEKLQYRLWKTPLNLDAFGTDNQFKVIHIISKVWSREVKPMWRMQWWSDAGQNWVTWLHVNMWALNSSLQVTPHHRAARMMAYTRLACQNTVSQAITTVASPPPGSDGWATQPKGHSSAHISNALLWCGGTANWLASVSGYLYCRELTRHLVSCLYHIQTHLKTERSVLRTDEFVSYLKRSVPNHVMLKKQDVLLP